MDDPLNQLAYAIEKYRDRVEVAPVRGLIIDSARQNAKRPAYVKLAMPDDLVKALRGSREQDDLLLLVRVPKDVQKRAESLIVLPGEV